MILTKKKSTIDAKHSRLHLTKLKEWRQLFLERQINGMQLDFDSYYPQLVGLH